MKFILVTCLLWTGLAWANALTLSVAKKLADHAASFAAEKSWNVTVAIVNAEGNLVYFQRGDGTYVGSIESAQQKALSANAFRRPTSAFVEAVKTKPGLVTGKNVVAIEGGVPVMLNGIHVGAIGVSGARAVEDEEVANAALKKLQAKN
jgi:glc operon protein GlcG